MLDKGCDAVCWLGRYQDHIIERMRWVRQHKTPIAIILGIIVLIIAGFWFWGVLVGYIEPKKGDKGITDRKDVVQVFALIVAGVVGLIGGIVGIANLSVSRRNLRQQIELEDQRRETTLELEIERSQDAASQAYFEQMGDLLTDHNLIGTERDDIRQLARAQTLTVLSRLGPDRKGALVRFLHGAELIKSGAPIVSLRDADLSEANLSYATLSGSALRNANLSGADLSEANLSGARLKDAHLKDAHLGGVNLRGVNITKGQLATCFSLTHATMPNGQKYEDWLKDKEGHGEDGETSGPSRAS